MTEEHFEHILQGMPVSPGIAMGTMLVETAKNAAPPVRRVAQEALPAEWQRLEAALDKTEKELERLKERVQELSGETEAAIFDAHLLFVRDRLIMKRLQAELPKRGQNIEAVYYSVVMNFIGTMRKVDDPYLRSRIADMEDVMRRVLRNMEPVTRTEEEEDTGERRVLVAYDLAPSDTADLDSRNIIGFVTEVGSAVSHTAILSRSLGLPAVVAVPNLMLESRMGQSAIVDGFNGLVIINPTAETEERYRRMRTEKQRAYESLAGLRDLPAETLDGHRIRLAANVEFAHESDAIRRSGAEGVGLYRTEFFLLGENREMPGEEEQYDHYRKLVENCAPHEVIFRTLDAGGDKLPCEPVGEKEANPFLGWRGIRVSLSRPQMFKQQLRAILRASAHGKVGVMFPMVSGLTEVLDARSLLEECRNELRAEGLPFDEKMRVGIMIEVPGAAVMADILAKYVDFFSIGTNDLTQYTIAVDRVNYRVASMFRTTHPGVIRLMHGTMAAGIPTAICGEMGADLTLTPLLVGLGASELSVGTHLLPAVRFAVRHLNYEECRRMAEQALAAEDSRTIRRLSKELALRSYPTLFE